jgi:hypothetical protein
MDFSEQPPHRSKSLGMSDVMRNPFRAKHSNGTGSMFTEDLSK